MLLHREMNKHLDPAKFSWAGAIFGIATVLRYGLWAQAAGIAIVAGTATAIELWLDTMSPEMGLIGSLIGTMTTLVIAIVVGLNINRWRIEKMIRSGWEVRRGIDLPLPNIK